jgi:hypothetical protein
VQYAAVKDDDRVTSPLALAFYGLAPLAKIIRSDVNDDHARRAKRLAAAGQHDQEPPFRNRSSLYQNPM